MKIQLVDEWKNFYKMYSFWFAVFIAVLPDIVNAAVQAELISMDQVSGGFSDLLKIAMFLSFAARLIKQEALRRQAEEPTEEPVV